MAIIKETLPFTYDEIYQDIAKRLNISRSYVSRLEKRATTKILREFIKNKRDITK